MNNSNLAENKIQNIEPVINPEFEKFLAPLPDKDFEGLEEDILERGVREPLVTWNGYLLDGHHRLKICKKHDLSYQTVAYEFEYGEVDAKIWIARNQRNRRNLTDFCKIRIELQLKDLYLKKNEMKKEKGREKGNETVKERYKGVSAHICGPTPSTQDIPERDYSGNTDRIIAENTGTSHNTVNKAEKIIALAPQHLIEKLETKHPNSTINSVFQELKNGKKREDAEIVGFPTEENYDVIYCDPYMRSLANPTGWEHKSLVIDPEDLPIKSAVMGEGMLFIWTPTFFFGRTMEWATKWGFVYRDFISWELAEEIEIPHRMMVQKQIMLMICSMGRSSFWDFQYKPPNLVRHNLSNDGSRHEQARAIIDRMIPQDKKKLEMFSNTKKEGWDLFTGSPVE